MDITAPPANTAATKAGKKINAKLLFTPQPASNATVSMIPTNTLAPTRTAQINSTHFIVSVDTIFAGSTQTL